MKIKEAIKALLKRKESKKEAREQSAEVEQMQKERVGKKQSEQGFTLIELTIVIAIIGVLMAMMIPSISQYLEDAKTKSYQADARVIATAAQLANLVVEEPVKSVTLTATVAEDDISWTGNDTNLGEKIEESVKIKHNCDIAFGEQGEVTSVTILGDTADEIKGTWTN